MTGSAELWSLRKGKKTGRTPQSPVLPIWRQSQSRVWKGGAQVDCSNLTELRRWRWEFKATGWAERVGQAAETKELWEKERHESIPRDSRDPLVKCKAAQEPGQGLWAEWPQELTGDRETGSVPIIRVGKPRLTLLTVNRDRKNPRSNRGVQPVGHVQSWTAVNVAQHKIVNLLETLRFFCCFH